MATTVENPFDTQPPKATDTSSSAAAATTAPSTTTSNGAANSTSAADNAQNPGLIQSALPSANQVTTYKPETRQINQATETTQGQLNSILSQDSPLMQRARTLATQNMAQRGLVNSSINQGAGVAAMIDKATPIAQQDANAYNAVSSENMAARNTANQFSAGEVNRFSLQKADQDFQAKQAQTQREFTTSERQESEKFTAAQQKIQNDFNAQLQQLQESGLDFRQARDIASREAMTKLEQQGIANRFDRELALKSEQFNIEQYNLERRQIMQNQMELDKLGLQIKANNQSIPTSFAANISNTAMAGVNAILSDGNLSPEAKKAAIDNLVSYANAQIGWAEKFYSTTIPKISTPG